MSLIESISRGALGLRADVSGSPAPWDNYWYEAVGSASSSGMRITEDSALTDPTVQACVGVIGKDVGMMPCKIYTESPDGSKRLVDNHPVYDLLYIRPNEQQTAFEFKQQMQGHLELRGNAYAEILPGPRGAVDQLIPMHPDRVTVERLKPSGRLRYLYNDPLTNQTRRLVQEEVFRLSNFADEGPLGRSTIAMGRDIFGVGLAQQDYSARFLRNDARPPFIFENTGFKTKEDREKFIDSWQATQTRSNRGKAAILPPGVTVKEIGIKPIDQQLIEARKFQRILVCSMFGVPPHLIGETEKTATYASVEQFNIMYAVHCILPRVVLWEQAIQRDLLTSSRYFAKFSMAALLRGDTASRFAAYHIALGDGLLNQDECRAFEDWNPIPGGSGKRYWRSAQWLPLDQTSNELPASGNAPDLAETASDDPNIGDNGSEQGSGDDGADASFQVREHLRLMVTSAADRCVRKEVSSLRKMVDRGVAAYELEEFYNDHRGFIAGVLQLDAAGIVPIRQAHFERSGQFLTYLSAGDRAGAYDFIDRLAATESLNLAGLAVGGKS